LVGKSSIYTQPTDYSTGRDQRAITHFCYIPTQ